MAPVVLTAVDRDAIAAGWQLTDGEEPDTRCPGSGQVPMFPDGRVTCPVCGAIVAAILPKLDGITPPYIVDHDAPTEAPPTLSLGL